MSPPESSCELDEQVWLVRAEGALDLTTAYRFVAAVERLLSRARPRVVAVDFKDVSFMDSSGIWAVLRAKKRLESIGGRLAVLRPHPMPRFLFRLTKLDRVVPVVDSIEEAVERSAQPRRGSSDEVDESQVLRAATKVLSRPGSPV